MKKHGHIWVPESFAEEQAPRPDGSEIATVGSDPDWDQVWSGNTRENPDQVIALESKGEGVKLYDDMDRKDPEMSSFVTTRINAVLSKDRTIEPFDDSDPAKEIADEATAMFARIPDFEQDLREVMRGISHGYSVSEIMWAEVDGSWDIADLVSRPQRRFKFDKDWQLMMLTKENDLVGEPVEAQHPNKFLVYSHNRAGMNRYGRGEYQFTYWPYFFKKNAIKFWAIFVERRASGITYARYDRENSDSTQRAQIVAALEEMARSTGIILPIDVEFEFKELASTAALDTMNDFVQLMTRWQRVRILGQTLTTGEGAPGIGQGAEAKEHSDVKQEYIEADAKELLPTLNYPLKLWTALNYGPAAPCPYWRIDYERQRDRESDARTSKYWLVDMGLPVKKEEAYERAGYQIPDDDDELFVAQPAKAQTESDTMPGDSDPNRPPDGDQDRDEDKDKFAEGDARGRAMKRIATDRNQIEDDAVAAGSSFLDDFRAGMAAHLKKKQSVA